MTRPPKPSLREALEPVFAKSGDERQIARRRRLLLGPAGVRSRRPPNEAALEAVREVLAREPDASSSAICAAVPFRKQDALDAIRELRPARTSPRGRSRPGNRFPSRERRLQE